MNILMYTKPGCPRHHRREEMSIEAMKQALEALENGLSDDKPYIRKSEAAITALRAAIEAAEKQEPPSGPYNAKRIGWELERTAMGDGYYGSAIRAAMDFEGVTPKDMTVLQRYAAGVQKSTDHVALQEIAMKLYQHTTPPAAAQPAPVQDIATTSNSV